MATHHMLVLGALAFLASQYAVCDAMRECHPFGIEQCQARFQNEHGCYLYSNVSTCLNYLIDNGNCTDKDHLFATHSLMENEELKNQCPGLEEGNCFRHQLGLCLSTVSTSNLYGKLKEEHCQAVNKNGDKAIDCMNAIKTSCSSDYTDARIKTFFYDIKQRQSDCWFHDKYEKNWEDQ